MWLQNGLNVARKVRITICGDIVATKRIQTEMKVGRAKLVNKPTTTKGKKYDKFFIYLSSYVVKDKKFPLKIGEELVVKIANRKLIIEKA